MTYKVSERPGRGNYICISCGNDVVVRDDNDSLPPCVRCEEGEFKKD